MFSNNNCNSFKNEKQDSEYNNSTNPFLISTKNIYEKPRLTPLHDDFNWITYQIFHTSSSNFWIILLGADPNGLVSFKSNLHNH